MNSSIKIVFMLFIATFITATFIGCTSKTTERETVVIQTDKPADKGNGVDINVSSDGDGNVGFEVDVKKDKK